MLCVVIKGPSPQDAHQQITQAIKYADIVELRLDFFNNRDIATVQRLRSSFKLPMLFTLRSKSQGGNYEQSEEKRLDEIRHLATLGPEYLDLESNVPANFIQEILSRHPHVKLILSYHNFHETPSDLDTLYQQMRHIPASIYKIALTAHNSLDAMRFLCWAQSVDQPLICISMGQHGQISRILGPLISNPMTYASINEEEATAPGQLSARILADRYHYQTLTPQTSLYGLIGNPVSKSISDVTHNYTFKILQHNAVYIKVQIQENELAEFLNLAKKLGFRGLSVTMPLKEAVMAYLDDIDPQAQKIGAVNTLVMKNGKITGYNTDGIGALNAIENVQQVKGKTIIVLGAGGAAKAIVYEAHRRGALVTVVNRNEDRGNQLAHRVGCKSKGLHQFADTVKSGYDILINCTSQSMPIRAEEILSNALVMDINTNPKESQFLKCALEKGCRVVYGYQMFVEQALGQYALWFDEDRPEARNILSEKALSVV